MSPLFCVLLGDLGAYEIEYLCILMYIVSDMSRSGGRDWMGAGLLLLLLANSFHALWRAEARSRRLYLAGEVLFKGLSRPFKAFESVFLDLKGHLKGVAKQFKRSLVLVSRTSRCF